MELSRRPPMHRCDCYMASAEGLEFQKIVESEDVGLTIYRYVPQTENVVQKRDTTAGEVFVLQNTKNSKVTSQDLATVFEQNVISCPRCLRIIETAENFLKDIPLIDREDVTGVCEHCVRKKRPLSSTCKCQDIVDKFLLEDRQQRKQQVKAWLQRVQEQLNKTKLDTGQTIKLKTHTRSEISLNTAFSKFTEQSEYKHFAEDRPDSQTGASHRLKTRLPRSAKATASLDSLHNTEKFLKPKEFDNLFAPLKYPKRKYDDQTTIPLMSAEQTAIKIKDVGLTPENVHFTQVEPTDRALPTTTRKLPQTPLPESVFIDPREYIKRVISPEAPDEAKVIPEHTKDSLFESPSKLEHKTMPSFFKLPEDKQLADKVLVDKNVQPFKVSSFLEPPKELKPEVKPKRTSILKSRKDDKVIAEKREQSSLLLDAPDRGKRTSILKSREDDKVIVEKRVQSSLLLDAPDRGKRKVSSPPPLQRKHSIESFLEDGSDKDMSRVFSFTFPKVKVALKKIEKRQVSSSELIKNTQDMLQAKAEEEKRKKEEELKRKREEEERKRLEREKRRQQVLIAKEKAEEEKRRAAEEEKLRQAEEKERIKAEKEAQALEDENKKSLKKDDQDLAEKPDKTKTTPVSSLSSKQKSDKVKPSEKTKTIIDKEALATEKVKVTDEKKNKQEQARKPKEEKSVDQERSTKDGKAEKQKDDIEKDLVDIRKIKPDKLDDENYSKLTKPAKKDDSENEGKQTKPAKKGDSENEGKLAKPVKKGGSENEGKQTKPDKEKKDDDAQKTKEPKEKNDKLEDNTLKALLLSQQKEKQEQEKMLREQQKEEELARKKAMEAAKSGKSDDKKAREEAANKLKKLKEAAAETPEPPPPKKKEEAPNTKDLSFKEVKMKRPSTDDLMLQLVKLKKEEGRDKKVTVSNINPVVLNEHEQNHKKYNRSGCIICSDSDLALDFEELMNQKKNATLGTAMKDVVMGEKIFKVKGSFKMPQDEPIADIKEIEETQVEVPKPVSPQPRPTKKEGVDPEASKGVIRYALSDRTFIDKGWTMLPTEKVVRKMNVYRMRPAHPEFDWFEHNKYKRVLEYDCGSKLAEIDDNGRGRWYYRSGKLALDYYDAEEMNAQQRFVVYSSGEPDERGRTRPRTILAAFDYLGNGVVFDHTGKIRLKYNQTEGVVLDRSIGPVSHWKWHTLNDPPVLQQVMIDTQMSFKDPRIMKLGEKNQDKVKTDNEEMLAIEFDNFIKEKSRKLTQKFKPFQIKMKALKINEYFSLRVLDQATVYLLFRDGTSNLKINMGMILDHKEIVDTDTAEVGEVSNTLERMPARTDSIAALQQAVAQAQRQERARVRHERRLKPAEPCGSADLLRAGISRPLRTPLMVASTTGMECHPQCPKRFRKPSASTLYHDTTLI